MDGLSSNYRVDFCCRQLTLTQCEKYGRVDRAPMEQLWIRVKPMTLKLLFIASLRDAQHKKDSVENKPASLLVVPLGFPHFGVVDR